ncbi:MAG: ATP-binding protein [Saprospiraceae bacterium]
MSKYQQTYLEVVSQLTSVNDAEKKRLLSIFRKMDKKLDRDEFMLMRIQKDKEIATNILNATIKDLENHKKDLQTANYQLIEQKTIIEKNLKKLENSYNELEQFSYIASHDLKSPLRTISSFAQLLKRRYYNKLDNDANDFITFIVTGIKQMNDVITNSLEYARVGQEEAELELIDFQKILKLVSLNLKDDIEEANAQIIFTDEFPCIKGNPTSILQLLQNLISNAIKFCKTTPIIELSFEYAENDMVRFYLKDNGIGIEEQYQKHIFLPFKRLASKAKPGQGIGLAICKKIVDNHGGEIHFTSVLNKGTTFIFTLPLYNKSTVIAD